MNSSASTIAYLALALVVPATIALFSMLSTQRAVLAMIIGSLMFLPSAINFDPPLIPPLDKNSIPALCTFVAVLVSAGRKMWSGRPNLLLAVLMMGMIYGVFGTTASNHDPLRYGPTKLPGLTSSDTVSELVNVLVGPLAPFLLGCTLFRTAADAKDLLKAFTLGALVYLPFVLIELRLSPQFHIWIYGYSPSSFGQTIREGGGYRPQVFMNHGLVLALFLYTATVAAWTLRMANVTLYGKALKPYAWAITVLLALVNSLGALLYAAVVVPMVRFMKPTKQVTVAVSLSLLVLGYPLLRSAGWFPVAELVDVAESYSAERAESLAFRFYNEDVLLEKALERPTYGWGGWGRSRVFNRWGRDITVTDGLWVIHLGGGGYVKFVTEYGLMLLPLFMARRKLKSLDPESQTLLAGVSLISVVHTVDLLPNAGCGTLFMFLPGCLAGLATGMSRQTARQLDPQTALRALMALRRIMAASGAPPRPAARPSMLT